MLSSKERARKALTKKLASLESSVFSSEGSRAAALLSKEQIFAGTETLLLFMSRKGEIDSGPILNLAFSGNKKVFLPRVEANTLRFYRILSPAGPWQQEIGRASCRERV
jgi:5-formyltetrahydrofolate cyclo-ligase